MMIMLFVKRGGGGVYRYRKLTHNAIFYQLSYFLTPARQCGKVVALQQVIVYKTNIATF